MADWFDVAGCDDIDVGACRVVDVDDVAVAVFNIDGEFVYRVRLGPVLNRDQSKSALNKVKAKYDIDGLIMKYNK